jgi:hypothetical protein
MAASIAVESYGLPHFANMPIDHCLRVDMKRWNRIQGSGCMSHQHLPGASWCGSAGSSEIVLWFLCWHVPPETIGLSWYCHLACRSVSCPAMSYARARGARAVLTLWLQRVLVWRTVERADSWSNGPK